MCYAKVTPRKTVVEDGGPTKITVTLCNEQVPYSLLKWLLRRTAITHFSLTLVHQNWVSLLLFFRLKVSNRMKSLCENVATKYDKSVKITYLLPSTYTETYFHNPARSSKKNKFRNSSTNSDVAAAVYHLTVTWQRRLQLCFKWEYNMNTTSWIKGERPTAKTQTGCWVRLTAMRRQSVCIYK